MDFLYYCRSGYEADLLAEIDQACALNGQYGYAKFAKNSAYLRYSMPQAALFHSKNTGLNDEPMRFGIRLRKAQSIIP